MYCNQNAKLNLLLNKLTEKFLEHNFDNVDTRFYSLLLRYFAIAIKLRNFKAVKIINSHYFKYAQKNLVSEQHYLSAIKNVDFDLILLLMIVENNLPYSLEQNNFKPPQLNIIYLQAIFEKTFRIIKINNEFYFLHQLYKKMLALTPHPNKLTIDLVFFAKQISLVTVNKMQTLLKFWIEQKTRIEFINFEYFCHLMFRLGSIHGLTIIVKLATIFDLKFYFTKQQPQILFESMNAIYEKYQHINILKPYFEFAENVEKQFGISFFIDYFKLHLSEIIIPQNPLTQKAQEMFLARYQSTIVETQEHSKESLNEIQLRN